MMEDSEFVREYKSFKCQACGGVTHTPVTLDFRKHLLKVCHCCVSSTKQILYFMQGVVFGQAMCMLLGHCPLHRKSATFAYVEESHLASSQLKLCGSPKHTHSGSSSNTIAESRLSAGEHFFYHRHLNNSQVLDETYNTSSIDAARDSCSSVSDSDIKSEPIAVEDVTKEVCSDCGKEFSTERHLYLHCAMKHKDKELRKTDKDKPRNKKKDQKRFTETYKAGNKSRENVKELPCRACWKMFGTKSALKSHQKMCHKDRFRLNCKLCSKIFFTKKGLTIHMTQTHKASRDCEICGESYPNYRELYNHKSSKHSHQRCVCHICGKHFKYQGALKGHLDAHAGVKRHFCDVCGKGFVRATSLYGHKANSHSDKPRPPSKRPRRSAAGDALQCQLCSETFVTKAFLNKHLLNEHSCGPYLETRKTLLPVSDMGSNGPDHAGSSYRCDLCGLQCMTAQGLELHRLQRGECVRTHICPDCGKGFTTAGYLQVHMKQHKEARFQCDECGKKFTYKCNLQSHLSVHKPKDSDKPYQCEVCKKWFRLQSYLDMHIRKHKQELALKCYICGKGLTRPQNLRNHILKMHPEAPQLN